MNTIEEQASGLAQRYGASCAAKQRLGSPRFKTRLGLVEVMLVVVAPLEVASESTSGQAGWRRRRQVCQALSRNRGQGAIRAQTWSRAAPAQQGGRVLCQHSPASTATIAARPGRAATASNTVMVVATRGTKAVKSLGCAALGCCIRGWRNDAATARNGDQGQTSATKRHLDQIPR